MKRKFIFFILLLIPAFIFGQTWRSNVDLNIAVSFTDRSDLFTNKDGNHVIVHEGNQIKYYLFSYNGSLVRSSTIVSGINEDQSLAKINGNNDYVYIVYKKGNKIYTKRSTNAGQSWSDMSFIQLTYNSSNGLDTWVDGKGLNLTCSEYNSVDERYDTYYKKLLFKKTTWEPQKRITDTSGDNGGAPTVATSTDKVHVSYTYGQYSVYNAGTSKLREKYGSTWQNPESVANDAYRNMIAADNSRLHYFYFHQVNNGGLIFFDLYHKSRSLSGSNWSSATRLLQSTNDPSIHPPDRTVSYNNDVHVVYSDPFGLYYRKWHNGWGSQVSLTGNTISSNSISANGNDIYVIWNDSDDETIYLKQCDYPPIAPRNVSISPNENDHPLLQWDANPEADLRRYRVYRLNHDPDNFIVYGTSFVDEDVEVSQSGTDIEYCVKAEDWYGNLSDASDQVGIHGYLGKRMVQNPSDNQTTPKEYKLYQNYPNPFNPITKIRLDLPKESFVSLVVLNINGQFVKRIFKGFLDAGKYQFPFDGSSLPSGIYIYRLKAKNYVSIKKMILTK